MNKDIVVFRYHVSPNFGMEGDDGGFSLELRGNGNLKFAAYQLFDEIKTMQIFKLNREETKAVFDLLRRRKLSGERFRNILIIISLTGLATLMNFHFWIKRFRRIIFERPGFLERQFGEEDIINGFGKR